MTHARGIAPVSAHADPHNMIGAIIAERDGETGVGNCLTIQSCRRDAALDAVLVVDMDQVSAAGVFQRDIEPRP